jgi:hypothetical protein
MSADVAFWSAAFPLFFGALWLADVAVRRYTR